MTWSRAAAALALATPVACGGDRDDRTGDAVVSTTSETVTAADSGSSMPPPAPAPSPRYPDGEDGGLPFTYGVVDGVREAGKTPGGVAFLPEGVTPSPTAPMLSVAFARTTVPPERREGDSLRRLRSIYSIADPQISSISAATFAQKPAVRIEARGRDIADGDSRRVVQWTAYGDGLVVRAVILSPDWADTSRLERMAQTISFR